MLGVMNVNMPICCATHEMLKSALCIQTDGQTVNGIHVRSHECEHAYLLRYPWNAEKCMVH